MWGGRLKKFVILFLAALISFLSTSFSKNVSSTEREFYFLNDSRPRIISASVEPKNVKPGDLMTVTVEVEDSHGIKSVTADMGGIETIDLQLVEGNYYHGKWKAEWRVHSTEEKEYITTITANNFLGKEAKYEIEWQDAPAWLSGWLYRKPIIINNTANSNTLTNYQVLVTNPIYDESGLVGSWHFNEGSGVFTKDYSNYSNDGTIYGATWVDGKFGKALSFDGVNDYVAFPNNTAKVGNSFSIATWIKLNKLNQRGYIIDNSGDGNDGHYYIYIENLTGASQCPPNHIVAGFRGSTAWRDFCVNISGLNTNEWYFITATYDGSTFKFYINAVIKNQTSLADNVNYPSNSLVKIGADAHNSWWFDGLIDEVRVYNRTLNDQEVLALYRAKARLDYGDIRFTDSDETTLLNYWQEADGKFWVKVPSIPANSNKTIYVYYGNSSANSTSNGDATFIFFDDFLGTSINTTKWPTCYGTISVGNHSVKITNAADAKAYIQSNNITIPFVVEGKWIKDTANIGDDARTGLCLKSTVMYDPYHPGYWFSTPYTFWYLEGTGSLSENPLVLPHIVGLYLKNTTSADAYRDRLKILSTTGITGISTSAPIAIHVAYTTSHTATWDWILVRNYTSPEPNTIVGEEKCVYCDVCIDARVELPYSINGVSNKTYCLISSSPPDFTPSSGGAINIYTSFGNVTNITLDCRGHRIDGSGTGYGIYIYAGVKSVVRNIFKNCIITDFYSGVKLYSVNGEISDNQFINFTIINNSYGVYGGGIFGPIVNNNKFINGSIHSNEYNYYSSLPYPYVNYFINTNFTGPRKMRTERDYIAIANSSINDVYLFTKTNGYVFTREKLINWTKDQVEWNDSSESSFTPYYFLSNLWPNMGYDVYVNGVKYISSVTNSSGFFPEFSVNIDAQEINIKLVKNSSLHKPDYSQASVNTTVAGSVANFTMKWNDTAGLSHYKFSFDNCTGSFVDDPWQAWPGNPTEAWVSVTKRLSYTLGCTVRWKVTANNTQGILGESEIYSFKTCDVPQYNNLGQNKTTNIQVGDVIKFYANWSDFDFLDTSIFSINASGSWQNVSFYKFGSSYTTFSDGSSSKNIYFYTPRYDNTTASLKLPIGSKIATAKMNISGRNLTGKISDVSGAVDVRYNYQRKIFYANGYYWAFWVSNSYLYYNTSSDGRTWSPGTLVGYYAWLAPSEFSVWTNETHVFYARTIYYRGGNLTFRIGRISGNTIEWNPEVTVIQGAANRYINYPFVSVSSDGYPWIGYSDDEGTASRWYPYVIRALNKDGTSWSTPFKLSTIDADWGVSVLPLNNGNMYIVYTGCYYSCEKVKGRLWNATSGTMGNEEDASTSTIYALGYDAHSAVAHGNDVHVVFYNGSLIYINRTTSGWSPETVVVAGEHNIYPSLSINQTNGELHLFYRTSSGAIGYCKRDVGWNCPNIINFPPISLTSIYNATATLGTLFISSSTLKFLLYDVTSYPSDIAIKVGNQDPEDWSFSSTLDETNSPKRIDLNTTKLTNILASCNCVGCSVSGSDCIIPIRVSTNTEGVIKLDDLYIFTSTQTGWSNFTQTVESSWLGKTIGWKIYTNDSLNNWNVTVEQTFTVGCAPPPSGDWIISSGQDCVCNSLLTVYGNLHVYGTLTMQSSCNIVFSGSDRKVYVYPGGNIYMNQGAGFNKP